MAGFRSFWRLIHEPYVSPHDVEVRGYPLLRLLGQYYLRPHWPNLIVIVVLGSLTGLVIYAYAAASKFVADDIVQIALIETQTGDNAQFDPALPGENRAFIPAREQQRTSWVQRLDEKPGKSTQEKLTLLGWLALAMIGIEIFRHVGSGIMLERTVRVTQEVQFRLRQRLHDKLHALPLHYHDTHAPGRLLTYLFSDMSVITGSLTNLMLGLPPNILALIVGAVLVVWIDPKLGGIVLACLPAYAVSYRWFSKRLKDVNRNLREREGRLNAMVANRVSNFQLVKSYGRESGEVGRFLGQAKGIVKHSLSATVLGAAFATVCGLMTGLCMTAVLWMGALRVRDGQLTAGELLMFYGAAGYLFMPVGFFTRWAGAIHRLRAVSAKVMHVLESPISITDPDEAVPTPEGECELEFDHVSMRYHGTDQPALSDISFTIPAGRKLCVMGPSGSGKSTVAKVAARLYDPVEGEVRIGGTDIKRFKIRDLRELVGFVNQEPIVFRGTIAENIAYGRPEAAVSQVTTAAQYAQIHDFIERLPEQYRTLTQERGLTLSGGQKQRVNLARVLIHEPNVLILDDCTSALDADTEAKLVEGFQTVLRGRTCMLVSHRTSIALQCDLVMMLDQGRIVDFGPPRKLLGTDGAFAAVVRENARKTREAEAEQAVLSFTGA